MIRRITFLALLLGLSSICTFAQNAAEEEKAIKAVVDQLFEGMKKGDSTLVRAAFHPSARMQSVLFSQKSQKMILNTENDISGFVKAVGTPHKEVWDERVLSYDIKIDGSLATVWTPYEFWLDNKFLHCGVDAFQFYKAENGWKIISIADTRRKDCK